jgi:hypothetical protein
LGNLGFNLALSQNPSVVESIASEEVYKILQLPFDGSFFPVEKSDLEVKLKSNDLLKFLKKYSANLELISKEVQVPKTDAERARIIIREGCLTSLF